MIMKIISKTIHEFRINNLFISKSQFQKIVFSSRNLEILSIKNWTLESLNVKFSSKFDSKLKVLSLNWCGIKENGNWAKTPKKLTDIFKAISESSLKDSLQKLLLFQSGLSNDFITKSFAEFDLENIELCFIDE